MQTLLPYSDFSASARVLDVKRLGVQRIENYQLMGALLGLKLTTSTFRETGAKWFYYDEDDFEVDELNLEPDRYYRREFEPVYNKVELPRKEWTIEPEEKPVWANSSVVKMWRGYEWALLNYQMTIAKEWQRRGRKDTYFTKTYHLYFSSALGVQDDSAGMPPWFGNRMLHLSHKSNLIRKDPAYYGPIFRGVPNDIPYLYPPEARN